MTMRGYHFNLDPKDRTRLDRLAVAWGTTASALLRRAVREFLAREEGKGRSKK